VLAVLDSAHVTSGGSVAVARPREIWSWCTVCAAVAPTDVSFLRCGRRRSHGLESPCIRIPRTLLAEHLAWDPVIGVVNPRTLRLWMIQHGCRTVRPRKRRERRAALGELTIIGTSVHPELEARSGEPTVLIALLDGFRVPATRFFPHDTGAANRQILIDYLQRLGRMQALYMDQGSRFRVSWRRGKREARDLGAG
jgi:hypothetical protein